MKWAAIVGAALSLAGSASAWLPAETVRGVNLGSLFIVEPWMMSKEWSDMGCGGQNSEFDCVMALGQDTANTKFQEHWGSWITQEDITNIKNSGLNTVRIPIGYWMNEDLVDSSEHFPQGGYEYLQKVCRYAADAGINVILDFHGVPGAQQADQPFTGQYASTTGFYTSNQYDRAVKFMEWITNKVHSDTASFSTVFAIEAVNEPLQGEQSKTASMISDYYVSAFNAVRSAEETLGISEDKQLHVQFMDSAWGSGTPSSNLPSGASYTLFDNHHYLKWTPDVGSTRESYMSTTCSGNLDGDGDKIVGEWSLAVADDLEKTDAFSIDSPDAQEWYRTWFAAQTSVYEKQKGWIFWSWKTSLGDWRWDYQAALAAKIIPSDLSTLGSGC